MTPTEGNQQLTVDILWEQFVCMLADNQRRLVAPLMESTTERDNYIVDTEID